MCEFISWIEKDGKLYYLTDDQTYSADGVLRLRGTQDNDVIGHGAIRRFYDIPACGSFCGAVRSCPRCGVERESQYFWQDEHLPAELRDKLMDVKVLDATWGRMLRESLQPDDVRRLLEGPDPLKRYAWGLAADLWSPDRRIDFLESYLEEARSASWLIPDAFARLAALEAPLDVYVDVLDSAKAPQVRRRARAKLRAYPRMAVLKNLADCLFDSWNADLLGILLTLDPSRKQLRAVWENLRYVMMGGEGEGCPELNRIALKIIADPAISREALSEMVSDSYLSYRVSWAAWRELLRRVPTVAQLTDIVDSVESTRLRRAVIRELKRRGSA